MMTQESEILRDARRTAEQILANAIRAASQLRSDVAAVADPEPEVIDLRDHVNPEPQG
jgi:vacuolar-type H+-ATPase subunit H